MRITVLRTHTGNCLSLYEALRTLGHEVSVIVYDTMRHDAFKHLPWMVDENNPDWVLMIGAHVESHGFPVPSIDVLAEIGERHHFVHLCCDAADPPWWPQLQNYYDNGRFALQVSIDGVRTGPIGERGLTMLSPIDPAPYPDPPRPWAQRTVALGFGGSVGAQNQARGRLIEGLRNSGLLTVRTHAYDSHIRDDESSAAAYREFMSTCRCAWNYPATGTERMHVKGRPIEAALAGCLVLEHKDSPLADWFGPGEDYLSWGDAGDIMKCLGWVRTNPQEAESMAATMRRKVLVQHSPTVFWARVMERLGMDVGKVPALQQPPYRKWKPEQAAAAKPGGSDGPPQLLRSFNGLNLVAFGGAFYVAPQIMGPLDFTREEHRRRFGVQTFTDEGEARRVVGG